MKIEFMREALDEAKKAFNKEEVPIGAVITKDNDLISRGHNLKETLGDPTAHAEMIAIRRAAKVLGGWRLTGCHLYVTIEPCVMCSGAIVMSRLDELIIGSMDAKGGATGSLYNIVEDERLNHQTKVITNVLEDECSQIMKRFFKKLRKR